MDHKLIASNMTKIELENKIDQLSKELSLYESKIKEVNAIRIIYWDTYRKIIQNSNDVFR